MLSGKEQLRALVELFKHGTCLTYSKDEFIIRPGEAPGYVYYIEEGLIKAYNISKYGEENLLIIRKSHEIFPLIWSLTGQERNIIYQALGPATLWRITRKTYIDYIHENPESLLPILDMVTEMYRIHSERILNLEYRTVRERAVSFLLTLGTRFGKKTPDGVVLEVPLRHQDIASSINATRETTSRELAVLERKGLITNKRYLIVLKDIKALKTILE